MRLQESIKIKKILDKQKPFANIINLGSGNVEELKKTKLWVSKNVFDLFNKQKVNLLHLDAEDSPGEDIVQGLSVPNSYSFCDKFKRSKLFILANVLENIPKKAHAAFLKKIYSKMKSKDGLIITAPCDYPNHENPIDRMYRSSPHKLLASLALI